MTGILEHAPLDTRVAWVRDLFERIDVDSRESHAVAVWKAATAEGVTRSDSVSSWLRRHGASSPRIVVSQGCVIVTVRVLLEQDTHVWS